MLQVDLLFSLERDFRGDFSRGGFRGSWVWKLRSKRCTFPLSSLSVSLALPLSLLPLTLSARFTVSNAPGMRISERPLPDRPCLHFHAPLNGLLGLGSVQPHALMRKMPGTA